MKISLALSIVLLIAIKGHTTTTTAFVAKPTKWTTTTISWQNNHARKQNALYSVANDSNNNFNNKIENDIIDDNNANNNDTNNIFNDDQQQYLHHERQTGAISRRDACVSALSTTTALMLGGNSEPSWAYYADEYYVQAPRPFTYFVDSTIPPTLVPVSTARQQMKMLKDLGKGLGTDKEYVADDTINLNNMMNKIVFGTIDFVQAELGFKEKVVKSGPGYASFVCLGIPKVGTPADIELAMFITDVMAKNRKAPTAIGLSFCPLSLQPALDTFTSSPSASLVDLITTFQQSDQISSATIELYKPVLEFAKSHKLALLALAPETQDAQMARTQGLQNVNPERRSIYIADTEGFIASTQSSKFRLYADRSLLKDFVQLNENDTSADFFAERILFHETAATAVARYATTNQDALVVVIAPTPDLRYLGGINGRIVRVCEYLNPDNNKITEDCVTTILLNPTARDTLSLSKKLRLEIGTAPETLPDQTKVSDYLWFSTMPKVYLIPRLMREKRNWF